MLVIAAYFVLIYLAPFFLQVVGSSINWDLIFGDNDAMSEPLVRSLVYALSTSLLITCLALIISSLLKGLSIYSRVSLLLSVLLLPLISGSISSAFIWKILITDQSFFFSSPIVKSISTGGIHFWEYGTLFIYIFWLNEQMISRSRIGYSRTIRMSSFERIRDFVLPEQRNLFVLLFIVGFITFLYDDSALSLIFKSSRGTHTEMIGQWLIRTYQSKSMINPAYGFSAISGLSLLLIFVALSVIGLFGVFVVKIFDFVLASKRPLKVVPEFGRKLAIITLIVLLLLILGPVIIALATYLSRFTIDFKIFAVPMLMTFISALISTVLAIEFSIYARLILKSWLSSLNTRSLLGLVSLLILLLAPPIVMLVCGFKWMQLAGYTDHSYLYIVWIISHVLLSFPLLVVFSVVAHFRVKNKTVDYCKAFRITRWELKRDIFYKPFRADYLLIFLLAYCSIWNEATINNVLSDLIPSFVSEINKTISGKGEDFTAGIQFLLVALSVSTCCILLWNQILRKLQKQNLSNEVN